MARPSLKVDWATHESARYACENWHYSRSMPTGKLVKIGAWEADAFVGIAIFSRGASPYLPLQFNLKTTELCELTRVAMCEHDTEVSKFLALSLRFLRKHCAGIRLVVSFADPFRGHHGGIYQATNWIYSGTSMPTTEYYVGGRWRHTRSVWHEAKGGAYISRTMPGKHRYLYPFDDDIRAVVESLRQPYPKRAGSSAVAAPPDQGGEGGSIPTPALHLPPPNHPTSIDE